MSERKPIEELAGLDHVVHEPSRLAILTALEACKSADFMFLQAATQLSRGNLSLHLAKLERHNLVAIEKTFAGKVPRTVLRLTPHGRTTIRAHWRLLKSAHDLASRKRRG